MPKVNQRPARAVNRVLPRNRDLRNRLQSALVLLLGAAAEIVLSERRICANHEQIITFVDPLVSRPSRQNRNVTRSEFECPPSGSTEAHRDMAASDPKHLVNLGVIVDVVKHAVPPGLL